MIWRVCAEAVEAVRAPIGSNHVDSECRKIDQRHAYGAEEDAYPERSKAESLHLEAPADF